MNTPSGRSGVVRARDDAGSMENLAHSVLDDILYNVLSDIVMKTHREEKTAKATTAAIRVEKMASDASDSSSPDSRPEIRVETDAAVYEDGHVLLKGNPLKTIEDILCPKCHLPRLLYPTDGKGAKKPDPAVIYCKKQPYIDKPGCDIYGQSWVAPGPGRGKKKKDVDKKDGVDLSTPEQRPPNVLSFPSATCSKCKRCILVTRLNNHMGSCIGNSGRNASRAAAQKINGNSQTESNSPSSQKATPAPGSRASSPRKREASDDDADDSDTSHQKKKLKGAAAGTNSAKKVIIKTKPSLKKEKGKGLSSLSQEQKMDSDSTGSGTPKMGIGKGKNGSPIKKMKMAKQALSSPMSKNGIDIDAMSDASELMSSPPGK